MKGYNGHRSWNAWNVALWINNDEGLYRSAYDLAKRYGVRKAARHMAANLAGERTPDGGQYNFRAIYEAIADILD